ncbi:hypothetical protein T12_15258 [Trichinella patagoniensis]|uniref:Uncharacterized protein n=1 Tax=Trichinella patagoniensis TaxID=990121 RepID=A0A0V0Z2D6_9BILA|nr:hypothetical protein T12_15258 [Trichinella patagoniensis]
MSPRCSKSGMRNHPLESFERPAFFHDSSELRNYAAVLVLPRYCATCYCRNEKFSPRRCPRLCPRA